VIGALCCLFSWFSSLVVRSLLLSLRILLLSFHIEVISLRIALLACDILSSGDFIFLSSK